MHSMQVDAIVFLVDAVDRDRFPESKRELDGLLSDEALAKVQPVLLIIVSRVKSGMAVSMPRACSSDAASKPSPR